LRLVNPFLSDRLGEDFGEMLPEDSLVSGTGMHALAGPQLARILFFSIGENDSYDNGGGDMTVRLGDLTGDHRATWFDPRTGTEADAGILPGGSDHVLTPPSTDDWILLVEQVSTDTVPPSAPTNLTAGPP
jgi:hypothetical protein